MSRRENLSPQRSDNLTDRFNPNAWLESLENDSAPPSYETNHFVSKNSDRRQLITSVQIEIANEPPSSYDIGQQITGKVRIRPNKNTIFEDVTVRLVLMERADGFVTQEFAKRTVVLTKYNQFESSLHVSAGKEYEMSFQLTIPYRLQACSHQTMILHDMLPPSSPCAKYYVSFSTTKSPVTIVPSYSNAEQFAKLYRSPFRASQELGRMFNRKGVARMEIAGIFEIERGMKSLLVPISFMYQAAKSSSTHGLLSAPVIAKVSANLRVFYLFCSLPTDRYLTHRHRDVRLREVVELPLGVTLNDPAWQLKDQSIFTSELSIACSTIPHDLIPSYSTCYSGVEYELELSVTISGSTSKITIKVPVVVTSVPIA